MLGTEAGQGREGQSLAGRETGGAVGPAGSDQRRSADRPGRGATRRGARRGGHSRLRGDVDRLLLYTAGKPRITVADAREVVSSETAQDDWAVTTAIQRGDTAEALRQLGLSLESGAVPFMILGQLAWFVREKLATIDARRVRPAIEAVFRTDLDMKSSGGDTRVLLERLVAELCRA